jgi:hypothetical protein
MAFSFVPLYNFDYITKPQDLIFQVFDLSVTLWLKTLDTFLAAREK